MKTIQEKTFDLLEQTGLNWEVKKVPLITVDGFETKSFGIMKSNWNSNGLEANEWLGTVRKQYEPYQNWQLAETIIEAGEKLQLNEFRGGALKENTKIYLQAELESGFIGKSPIKRFITALNSHDGSSSIGFGSTNTVVVCQNTFYKAYKEINKFRHTITADSRVKEAVEQFKLSIINDELLMEDFKLMASKPLNDEVKENVIRMLFKVDKDTKQNDVSTRKLNQIVDFASSVNKSIEEQGNTIWALFNGVTRYTNHIAAPTEESSKLTYLMDGQGYNLNQVGFDTIMDWIRKNSIEFSTI
jgi:phage/plasmid-like protein (TIGR03299 family)